MSEVCIVSSNVLSREGLSRIIESQGFCVAASVAQVEDISWSVDATDQVILLDCGAAVDQNRALQYVMQSSSKARAIVLAETFELDLMTSCLRSGAHGYLVKNMAISSLVSSINLAAAGEKVLPSELVAILCDQPRSVPEPVAAGEHDSERTPLSQREYDVLNCIMAGYANKLIARHLSVAEATIKVHVKGILRKLKVMNRTQAAIWAASHGLPGVSKPNCSDQSATKLAAALH